MGEVDAHYRALVNGLPVRLQADARHLPFTLGLVPSPDDGWEAFVKLPANRDLPMLAADPCTDLDALQPFRAAHWAAGYYGCLIDRIADGQTAPTTQLHALSHALRKAWQDALTQAIGSRTAARTVVDRAFRAFARGIALERQAISSRLLAPTAYGELTREKSAWVRTAAVLYLECTGDTVRARAFRLVAELAMMAMQCADDAVDAEEDRQRWGTHFPEMLGLPPAALMRTAPRLLAVAQNVAENTGFVAFAEFLSSHAFLLDERRVSADPFRAEVGAMALSASLLESWPGLEHLEHGWSEQCTSWRKGCVASLPGSACHYA